MSEGTIIPAPNAHILQEVFFMHYAGEARHASGFPRTIYGVDPKRYSNGLRYFYEQ